MKKLLQVVCKLQIKKIRVSDFNGQKLVRVEKLETQVFFPLGLVGLLNK
jgi:hypothetical protein